MDTIDSVGPRVTFLIGASGAGKSTIAHDVVRRCASICCLRFDQILGELGLWAPGEEEAWQRRATFEWCRRVKSLPASRVLLEGQTRYEFVADACAAESIEGWDVILVHCDREERHRRLTERGDTELVSPQMDEWADWLLADARARKLQIVDTTQSLQSSSNQLSALLGVALKSGAPR